MAQNDDSTKNTLEGGRAVVLADLVAVAPEAIVSRTLAKTSGGTVTLFAFDAGQALSEHTAPFDALVQLLEGGLELTIGGAEVRLQPGEMVLMPAHIPHGLKATSASRMLLVMLRDNEENDHACS